jgi:sugar phosphate isomerase/epimerase
MGFAGLLFDDVSSTIDLTTLSQSGRREFLHVLSTDAQQLVGLRTDIGTTGLGPKADIDRILAKLSKAMDAAVGLLAPLVCVDLGALPQPAVPEPPKPQVTKDMAGLILLPSIVETPPPAPVKVADPIWVSTVEAAVLELAHIANRAGVTLAFRTDLSSFAALARVLEVARCPFFGVDLDPVAVLRDAWDVDAIFSAVGPAVMHVRGRDAVVGTDNRTKPAPIGKGDTKWDQLLSDLDAAGFHGFLTIDPTELPQRSLATTAGLAYLKLHGIT